MIRSIRSLNFKNLAARAGRLIWAGLVDLAGAAVVAMAAMAIGAMAISVSALLVAINH